MTDRSSAAKTQLLSSSPTPWSKRAAHEAFREEVCPRNQRRLKAKLPQNEFLTKLAQDFELTKLLNLSDEFYTKRVQPLMYNYIRGKKYLQRNAAIAPHFSLPSAPHLTFCPDLVYNWDRLPVGEIARNRGRRRSYEL